MKYSKLVSPLVIAVLVVLLITVLLKQQVPEIQYIAPKESVDDRTTLDEKIEQLKGEVLDGLKQCESGDATQDDAPVNPKDGGSPSFGLYQFKIETVQHYKQKFNREELTRLDALLLSLNGEQSRELAEQIIFDEVGGIWNWETCAKEKSLAQEISLIRKLME